MNGDLSRVTFDPLKHFTRVVMLQGRVQVDADWNEQAAILLHYLRALAADLIGQHGGPDDLFTRATPSVLSKRNCGFAIIAANKSANSTTYFPPIAQLSTQEKTELDKMATNTQIPLLITSGHYYVDGLLCENEDYRRYSEQPDLQQANDDQLTKLNPGTYLLYLDVSERHVTALDDPSIREVALGGADTSARTRLIWQVKIYPEPLSPAPAGCIEFNDRWSTLLNTKLQRANRGTLRARAKREDTATDAADPCITSPDAHFRGMENHLYRVEIHKGGVALNSKGDNLNDAATFKWSRDNGTIVAALKRKVGDDLIVSGLRDFSRWFIAGNWVEITHDALDLNGLPGTMVRVIRVEGESLTIDPDTATGTIYEPQSIYKGLTVRNVKVRRWDHHEPEETPLRGGAIPIVEGQEIEMEDGVSIFFEGSKPAVPPAPPAQYRTGDYWLIPARVVTGDVEWPFTLDPTNQTKSYKGLPPHGVEHHYAPLAAITLDAGHITAVVDLRHKFPGLGGCPGSAIT